MIQCETCGVGVVFACLAACWRYWWWWWLTMAAMVLVCRSDSSGLLYYVRAKAEMKRNAMQRATLLNLVL